VVGVRALVLDVPQEWLDERHRLDLDGRDEMWNGVLHMVPPASSEHNSLGARLMAVLLPIAVGLEGFNTPGVFDPASGGMTDYRVPDLGFAPPELVTKRGIEGRAALVVEILSPTDDSYEKLPFYRRVGVGELLYIDAVTKAFEVRRPARDGWAVTGADQGGRVRLASLDVDLRNGRCPPRGPHARQHPGALGPVPDPRSAGESIPAGPGAWTSRPVAARMSRKLMGSRSRDRRVVAVSARPANRSRSTSASASHDDPVQTTVSSPTGVSSRRNLTVSVQPLTPVTSSRSHMRRAGLTERVRSRPRTATRLRSWAVMPSTAR